MSETQRAKFVCEECGKSYTWKPELAGKKAKCKCGAVMLVPQTEPGADELAGLYDLAEDDPPPRRKASAQPVAAAEGASTMRCPSCQSAMEAGAVICLACGFNLKTGSKMNTAIGGGDSISPIARPPAASGGARAAAAAVPPGIRPVQMKSAKHDYEQGNQKKMLVMGGLAIVLVGGLVAAFLMLRDAPAAEPMLGDDAAIVAQMKDESALPAVELLDKGRLVSGMTISQARRYVDRLKEMGAVEVYGADRHMTRYLVIELPTDPAQRKELFDYEHRWHTEMHQKPAQDVGQKYLKLSMRL